MELGGSIVVGYDYVSESEEKECGYEPTPREAQQTRGRVATSPPASGRNSDVEVCHCQRPELGGLRQAEIAIQYCRKYADRTLA